MKGRKPLFLQVFRHSAGAIELRMDIIDATTTGGRHVINRGWNLREPETKGITTPKRVEPGNMANNGRFRPYVAELNSSEDILTESVCFDFQYIAKTSCRPLFIVP